MDLSEPRWRKSSYSGSENECVEAAVIWRKSIRSHGDSECIEAAIANRSIALRDSKDPTGPRLYFTAAEWKAFLLEVRQGNR